MNEFYEIQFAVVVSDAEFDEIVSVLSNPKPPTETIKLGAALLRRLYRKS